MKYILLFYLLTSLNSCISFHNSVPKVLSNATDFVELEDKISTHPRYLNGQNLNIIYQENYHDQDDFLEYRIYNQKQEVVQSHLNQSVKVKYGLNKISIPLNNIYTGIFILEITNEKGVKKYLTFLKSV